MRPLLTTTLLSLLSSAVLTRAGYPPFDYSEEFEPTGASPGNQSMSYVAPSPQKYTYWYGAWRPQLTIISEGVCNLSLDAYRGNATARETLGPVRDYCWTHSNCILQTITEDITQSIAGASILLGLTPTILSVLGPSVAEMALLSMHRPLLSLLLSLGAPAVYPGRFLVWEDPLRANEPQTGAWVVHRLPTRWAVVVSVVEYILALGAITVSVQNAWNMGVRAVLVWFCDSTYWPLLWVVLSVVIHTMAILALRVAIRRKHSPADSGSPEPRPKVRGFLNKAFYFLCREFTPTANSATQVRDHYDVHLGPLAVIFQYIGALAALVHLIFGTAMFSSLLYIGNTDAISLILRFAAAAVVCRVVLQFEIGGMIRVGKERDVWRGIVQPLIHHGHSGGEPHVVVEGEDEGKGEPDPNGIVEIC